MDIIQSFIEAVEKVKRKKPLIENITNNVTINDCANVTLAIGASPIMADAHEEVEDVVAISSAVVLNMGILTPYTVESMLIAGKKANELGIPVVFDPVGAGATPYRNKTAEMIISQVKLAVIRGNMSEIKFLNGMKVKTKGVDSVVDESDGASVAREFAVKYNLVAAVTGKIDYISDGKRVCIIKNGHEMLSDVTGTGCMATALCGAFCGAESDYFIAALSAVATMGIAGELAKKALRDGDGIGTFRVRLFDSIYNLDEKGIRKEGKLSIV
ncbi:MAG: hydroxyethylthiazole kinase [Eubacteriales bacterium]